MKKRPILPNCKSHLTVACKAINMSYQAVKTLFRGNMIQEIPYPNKRYRENMLEIRLDNATLNCLFNKRDICEGIFLFFDDPTDLIHYVQYCSQNYRFHPRSGSWINDDSCIQLNEYFECNLIILAKPLT